MRNDELVELLQDCEAWRELDPQLNSTQVYSKTVAERLKDIQ